MNYPRILQDKQLVYFCNELTHNKQILCEVLGFISQTGIYIIQELKDIPRGIFNGQIYYTEIDNLSLERKGDEQ